MTILRRWLFMTVVPRARSNGSAPIRLFSPSPRVPLRQALSPVQNSPDRKIRGAGNKIPEGRRTENSPRSSRPLAATLSSMILVVFSLFLCTQATTTMRSVPVPPIETIRHIFVYYILIAFFCDFICQLRIVIDFTNNLNVLYYCYYMLTTLMIVVNHA
jgi:hypothetical protein